MRSALALMLLAPVAMVSSVAQAAETGSIRGELVDEGGIPIPGVSVVLSGVNIAGERVVTSDADGRFRLDTLPPGTHELLIKKDGFATMRVTVTVRLDQAATVPVTMVSAVGSAEIIVEEILPVIDVTRSSVSTNLSADLIQNLPVARSYQQVVNMLPGVSGRVDTQGGGPGNGNPSVRGEGQYGNNFLMDGISTRDPVTKTFGMDINFDAIEEIQVYTDGLPAEFSQATGMLVNVVLKDGGDEHFGSAGYFVRFDADPGQYDILDLETGEEVPTDKRDFLNHEIALTAGGPLIQDRLWYMTALTLEQGSTQFEAMDEDNPYVSRGIQGFGKLTFFATPNLSFQYMGGASLTNISNYETSGLWAQEAQSNYVSNDFSHIGTVRLHPAAGSELELKATYIDSNIDVVPASGDATTPLVTNVETGQRSNNYSDFDYNNRRRLGASLKYTQLIDGVLGDHRVKVGVEGWRLTDSRELLFTGPSGTNADGDSFVGVDYLSSPSAGYPCTKEANYTDCFGYTEHVSVGAIGNRGIIVGGFLQDDWQPVERLTLNLGMRVDSEILFANYGTDADGNRENGDRIYGGVMPAPRTGLAWDITGDGKNLFTVNYGRYYDVAGNAFADWGATRNAAVYREYQVNPDTGEMELVWVQDPETDPLIYCTEESLENVKVLEAEDPDHWGGMYDMATEACSDADGNVKEIRPYHSDKLVVGYTREILPNFALGIRGIMSATTDLPEDIDYNLDAWVISNPTAKRRDYRALELVAQRKFDGRWQMLASYTLSEAKGHMPGQFELSSGGVSGSNGNDVGVYMDDVADPATREFFYANGYGWLMDGLYGLGTADDDQGYYGYLPYHSFHAIKLNGSYTIDWVGGDTTIGAAYEWDSGRAWQKRGLVSLYGDYYAFPEGRGSRFMPSVTYFDLRVAHALSFGNEREVELSADLFNVLGLESATTLYENDNESFGATMYRQSPRSVRLGARFNY